MIHSELLLFHKIQICKDALFHSIPRVTFPPEIYPVQVFSFVLQYLQGDILIWLLLDQY